MKRFLFAVGVAVCAAAGCSEFFSIGGDPPGSDGQPSLKRFSSENELVAYFRGEIGARNSGILSDSRLTLGDGSLPEADGVAGGTGTAAPPQAGADDTGSSFSQTTIQEAGVDESDVVKTDGEFLYLIDDTSGQAVLRIVRAAPAAQLGVVSETQLEGYGRELYLHGETIVAVTAKHGGYYYAEPAIDVVSVDRPAATPESSAGDPVERMVEPGADATDASGGATVDGGKDGGEPVAVEQDGVEPSLTDGDSVNIQPVDLILPPGPGTFERPRVIVTVIDVGNPSAPAVMNTTWFDGSVSASRMIDGKLHLVIANYQHYYFDVMPRLGLETFDAAAVAPATLLPKYDRSYGDGTKESGDVLTYAELYRPAEPDGFGVVTVVSMDGDANADFRATGVVAEPGLIYSSREALYLTNTNYDFLGNMRNSTDIYKFAYQDGRAVPVSAGRVPGRLLNQYSLGEHEGVLRVATTVDPTFGPTGQITTAHNNVYCLADGNGALSVMGRIENIAPRETIQSCRFVGDRGYVVTFEQIDPLFTLDLSDPANPRIVGELKVPGFSTFIVPLDEGHLLTVGQYVPEDRFRGWGVQLSIFDVSDFARPLLTHSVVLGEENGSWSEALYDPKAFNYYRDRGLLALPVSIYPGYQIPVAIDGDFDSGVRPDAGGTSDGGGAAGSSADSGVAVVESGDTGFEGVVVYRVSASEGFSELGRISTRFEIPGFYSWNSFTRGVFIDEDVYAVTNMGTRAAAVGSTETLKAEVFYGQQYPIDIGPLPADPIMENIPFGDDGGSVQSPEIRRLQDFVGPRENK
jgi:uncharacterized secreted protein with C-terminal beta-propeller domain